jgi:DNA primase
MLMDIMSTKEFQTTASPEERLDECIHFFRKKKSREEIHHTKKKMLESVKVSADEKDIVLLLDEFHKKNRNIHALKRQGAKEIKAGFL